MTDAATCFDSRPWTTCEVAQAASVRRVPTMLSHEEQQFYGWLGAGYFKGQGDIVDLGAFVGGSTARLAEGLGRAHTMCQVHAFDRFTAGEDVKASVLYAGGVQPFEGNDILPIAKNLLAPWQDRIVFHQGLIENMGWSDRPIEILAVDAFKSVETMDQMVRTFFPALIPGQSLLIQQDFLHRAQPWIAALMLQLRDVFQPIAYVRKDTLVFKCIAPITEARLQRARITGISDTALLSAVRQTRRLYRGWGFGHRLTAMEEALRAAPGCRTAWKLRQQAA